MKYFGGLESKKYTEKRKSKKYHGKKEQINF